MPFYLSRFREWVPPCTYEQEKLIGWLASAHAHAESKAGGFASGKREGTFREQMEHAFRRYGATGDEIRSRASVLRDFGDEEWRFHRLFTGLVPSMEDRMDVFGEAADQALGSMLGSADTPPDDLVHVTSTGYLSPSPAQRLAELRGWQSRIRITHAYQMDCYAAFSAIRIASGFASAGGENSRTTVAHTEFCTLHFQPLRHSADQMFVQSMFADGVAAYDVTSRKPDGPSLEVVAMLEEIIPGTLPLMVWAPADGGMTISLAREVPAAIREILAGWFGRLAAKAGMAPEAILREALFTLHPGGNRILSVAEKALDIRPERMSHIRRVFETRGDMSSASLPISWLRLLSDPSVADGTPVVAAAFGPGLTASGAVFIVRKEEFR